MPRGGRRDRQAMDELFGYYLVVYALIVSGYVAGWWTVFRKAGQPSWAALIPLYNIYVLVVGVARLSTLWFILVLIPIFQVIPAILVNVEVARRFGRSEAFGLGLFLLGPIFYPVLGFGSARYQD
jgi:hypothetical protein